MELDRLIEALSHPDAYDEPVAAVEVRQTHISAVFLTEAHAYKIKKPVALAFLDFSTLERRRHYCHEEVRLNRRLAPQVYLDVVPITASGDGGARVAGQGEPIEWAVKMERLPDEGTLEHHLRTGTATPAMLEALARRIAGFHARADRGQQIAQFGRYEVVERNALENFEQSAGQVGTAVSREVFARLRSLSETELARQRALVDARAQRGVPGDTHGDLRPAHVYFFPDRAPPDDLVVVDCIEFNERFRFADPVSDMAFLVMGLDRAGHADLAAAFAQAYIQAADDAEGLALLPFYLSYRAAVRGKVDGMQATDSTIPMLERDIALSKARGFWLAALAALETPDRKPCLLLVGGLPGTGKSTLAAALAERAGCEVVRSDVVRKELAGVAPDAPKPHGFEQGIYAPEWTQRTYAECRRRAERLLFEGRRVVLDASFGDDKQRREFLDMAVRWGVPCLLLLCRAAPDVVRQRLARRTGDASDADWSIYQQAARRWQPPVAVANLATSTIDTGTSLEQSLQRALSALARCGLVG